MRGPADPVDRSVAPKGEIADAPESADDLSVYEATDQDDDAIGLLVKWDSAEWLWADIDSYHSLDETQ